MDTEIQVQIQDGAVGILCKANTLEKDMYSTILPSVIGK